MPFSPKHVRIARRLLISLAVFATLITGFYAIENRRGDRAWQACVDANAALGESLDTFASPSSIPAETNFMKTPLLDRMLYTTDSAAVKALQDKVKTPHYSNFDWYSGKNTVLEKFSNLLNKQAEDNNQQTPSAAAAVLEALTPLNPELTELRRALFSRPNSQAVRPQSISTNNTSGNPSIRREVALTLTQAHSLAATADLQEGDTNAAFENLLVSLRIVRGITDMPDSGIIEAIIGSRLTHIPLHPIWVGCQEHAWSTYQMEKLQNELEQINPLAAFERALRQEQAYVISLLQHSNSNDVYTSDNSLYSAIFRLGPRGWRKQNSVTYVNLMQPHLNFLKARGTSDFLSYREKQLAAASNNKASTINPYSLGAYMAIADFGELVQYPISADINITLAQTACALERFRISTDHYPQDLEELVPHYIDRVPTDVINGQPLHYSANENGRFTLYSIGLDGKDDGGSRSADSSAAHKKGDWLIGDLFWPQPSDN